MKNKFATLLIGLFLFVTKSQAKSSSCLLEISDTGRSEVIFNSKQPFLSIETQLADASGHFGRGSLKIILSDQKVCGRDINVSQMCKAEEKIDPRLGYQFSLSCTDNLGLSLYLDEDGTAAITCTLNARETARYTTYNCRSKD